MKMGHIIRNIYPIGQGGFCSEKFYGQNNEIVKLVVYDCGETSKKVSNRCKSIVNGLPNHDIDILFISHFDHDHISLVSYLKSIRKIKYVVVPLAREGHLLWQFAETDEEKKLIENIYDFFDNDTIIIRVKEFDEQMEYREDVVSEENNVLELEEISSIMEIESGQKIKVSSLFDWIYIPFNIFFRERQRQFQEICKKKGIDILKLSNNDYTFEKSNLLEIKAAYKSVDGGINQNSLVLYSGLPTQRCINSKIASFQNLNCCLCFRYCKSNFFSMEKEACLYTGDWDCTSLHELFNFLRRHKNNIGIIQIPHHGSKKSFKEELIIDRGLNWFVQYGEKNTYGHPSADVLSKILLNYGNIFSVTDNSSSAIVQLITVQ